MDIRNYLRSILLESGDSRLKHVKNIITESQESKSIHAAKRLVMQRLSYNEDEADKFIRITLRGKLDALKEPQCGKFILGVARMYCDGELNDKATIDKLNATLELVASDEHINEFDRNLNGISCDELIQMFSQKIAEILDAKKKKVNSMKFTKASDYDIVRIDSFDEARRYGEYTKWCVTQGQSAFDEYTNMGNRQFYFCLKHGFESVPKRKGKGCPLDKYGLSMIAVLVNLNGSLAHCTCRWNHDNKGDDYIMNDKEISKVVGVNFYETFKPNTTWEDALSEIMEKLAKGADPHDVFDKWGHFKDGFMYVRLRNKCNFLTADGKFLSDTWFNYCSDFNEGFACVALNDKWNFLATNGKFLSDTWFDRCYDFKNGFACVKLNGKENLLTADGKFISNNWFDYCRGFENGFSEVKLNGKRNFLTTDGKILSNTWFDDCEKFKNDFACVELNGKKNLLSADGKIVSNTWFDKCYDFENGFARVELSNKYNLINTDGKILSDTWFDHCGNFYKGFADVWLNGKQNFLTADGKILSGIWFDECGNFYDGFSEVKLNGKRNFLTKDGKILSDTWFDFCYDFESGFAIVWLNGKGNFLTTDGKILSDTWFDECGFFKNGFADVTINDKQYKIDTNGTISERSIGEGKRNRKPMLITKSDLHRIIKESVRLALKNAVI